MRSILFSALMGLTTVVSAAPTQYYVSPTGDDTTGTGAIASPWKTIQKALFTIPFAEDEVDLNLRAGTYTPSDVLYISTLRGGSESGTFRIKNYDGENAIIDGSAVSASATAAAMFSLADAHYVTIEGLEITNLTGYKSGIYVSGSSSNISIYKNEIHDMHWTTDATLAAAPTPSDNLNPIVILGNSTTPMSSISVMDNDIYNMTTGYSEAVKVVGNVDGFIVEGNDVYDISNICIVAAGNYAWVGLADADLNHARNGIIRYNKTYRCVSPIAASAGIYVDGGKDIFISENYSHHNTVGFSVGSEQPGEATGIVLSRNDSSENTQAGLILGTMTAGATVSDVIVTENEFYGNYTDPVWGGAPIIFSNAESVTISDNKIKSISQYMITANGSVSNLTLDRNDYTSKTVDSTAAVFAWLGIDGSNYFSFDAYQTATGEDHLSTFTYAP